MCCQKGDCVRRLCFRLTMENGQIIFGNLENTGGLDTLTNVFWCYGGGKSLMSKFKEKEKGKQEGVKCI